MCCASCCLIFKCIFTGTLWTKKVVCRPQFGNYCSRRCSAWAWWISWVCEKSVVFKQHLRASPCPQLENLLHSWNNCSWILIWLRDGLLVNVELKLLLLGALGIPTDVCCNCHAASFKGNTKSIFCYFYLSVSKRVGMNDSCLVRV